MNAMMLVWSKSDVFRSNIFFFLKVLDISQALK